MSEVKVYLNVPYAQKDAAKALGARWDPALKKWYVPPGKTLEAFSAWCLPEDERVASSSTALAATGSGVVTQPGIADFVAYDGAEAPWD